MYVVWENAEMFIMHKETCKVVILDDIDNENQILFELKRT